MAELGKFPARSADDLPRRLERLWQEGPRPEVRQFVAAAGPLSPGDLAAVLRVDQRELWFRGERFRAETYLEWFPSLCEDAERAVELIYGEYLLREHLGDAPRIEEYFQRFPAFADRLRLQFDLHHALATESSHAIGKETPSAGSAGDHSSGSSTVHVTLPESFGRYRILNRVGQGGMGSVYLAHDTMLDRKVALKVPNFEADEEDVQRERFLREARSAAALDHPNVCSVYDVGEIDGICYLTMAFIDGKPLSRTFGKTPAPQRRAAELVQKIALAMAEAHDHGIVHRDLKPANIMISTRGEPVVMDFGLARSFKPGDARLTQSGSLVGTPAYMSPEQACGNQNQIGPASDIYSLGIILYELVTGRVPFQGGMGEVLAQVIKDMPRPLSTYHVDVDPRLEAICLRTLEKRPEDRQKTMRELASELEAYLLAQGPPPAARAGDGRFLVRRLPVILGLAATALLASMAVYLLFRERPAPPTDPETGRTLKTPQIIAPLHSMSEHPGGVECVVCSGDGRQALSAGQDRTVRTWNLETGQEEVDGHHKLAFASHFALALDGRSFVVDYLQSLELHAVEEGRKPRSIDSGGPHSGPIAFAGNGRRVVAAKQAALGEPYALVWDLETDQKFQFKGHKEEIQCVALSTDGRQGLSAGSDGVRWWDVETGEELGHLKRRAATCLAFAPEAGQALVGEDRGALSLWDLKTGQPKQRLEGHDDAVTCATFSPDGTSVLSGSADKSIRLWDARTGRELARLQGHTQRVTSVVFSAQGSHALSGSADGTVRWWKLP